MPRLYLKKYGHKLIDNGYEVVGITPGTKHPSYDYSSEKIPKIGHKHVDRLLSNGHARDGIGIRTRFTPMFDIDCLHKPMVEACIRDAEDVIGFAPARIGRAPKVGLIFRSISTFKKVQSKAYTDPKGRKAQVEFLGDGQQFAAFAIHPETKKPYRWTDEGYNLLTTPQSELPGVTEEQAIEVVNRFEQRCIDLGWERWKTKSKSTALTTRTARDPDDLLGSTPLNLSLAEVREWVERLPNDDSVEYEDSYTVNPDTANYRNVLFAIWHETQGSDEGREIAWDWSESNPSKHEVETGRFEKLWGSADDEGRDDAVTFRYIIKCVLTLEENERKERRDGFIASLQACGDADDLEKLSALIAKVRFSEMDLERLAQELKRAFNRITGFTYSIEKARKQLYHVPAADELPPWIKPWVYIQHTQMFFNRDTGLELDYKAFEATYSRYLGGASAVDFALNKAQIKPFWMQMYKPDAEEDFWFEGHECINTFSERLMPAMPGKFSNADKKAIKTVLVHLKHILPSKRERAILLSFMSYIVKTYQRPNWAVVLQGVDGDGKSFLGALMGAVLGSKNVRMLDAQQLEDRYTGWAVGQLFTFIEELKMHGHSRYDILNKIKPYITNEAINVHPKNVNPYTALNTTAYMATTNFKDALPLNDNDRRYFVLMSAWQTGDMLRKFLFENLGYFERLFAVFNHAGALRQYLVEYEPHEEFNPKGRAPMTRAREEMVSLSKSEGQAALEEAIKENKHPRISHDLIVSNDLIEYLEANTDELPSGKAIASLLASNGYVKLKHRIRLDSGSDNKASVWVRERKQFERDKESAQRSIVVRFLSDRQLYLNHKNTV